MAGSRLFRISPAGGMAGRGLRATLLDLGLVATILVVLWSSIGLHLRDEKLHATRDAARNTGNVAGAAAQVVARLVGAIDQRLLLARDLFRQDPAAFARSFASREGSLADGPTFQLAVIRPDGMLWLSSLGVPDKPVDLSDRAHFRAQANSSQDELFISVPVLGRESGRWSVQFTRKLLGPDGRFAGVLVASLDPYWLTELFGTLDVRGGVMALFGLDGVVRARAPFLAGALGRRVDMDKVMQPLLAGPRHAMVIPSPLDGRARIVGGRRVPGLPLVVVVGQDVGAVLASYRDYRGRSLLVGGGLTLLVVLVGALLVQQQHRQRVSRQALSDAVENIDQGLLLVGADGRVAVLNRRAADLLSLPPVLAVPGARLSRLLAWQSRGRDEDEAPGAPDQTPWTLAHALGPATRPADGEGADAAALPLVRVQDQRQPDGRILEARITPLDGGGLACTYTDVTRERQADQRIRHLAHHDVLTDLPNRVALQQQLARTLDAAGRRCGRAALLCLDLDRFKPVNDLLGHAAGDALLVQAARRLEAELGAGDMLARVGGDEFVVVAASAEQPDSAAALATRLIGAIARPFDIDGRQVELGVSVGVALFPADGETDAALLHAADIALYRAKEEERGCVRLFEPQMDERLRERRQLEQDLRHAVGRGELVLHFQPILCLRRGRIVGFEALLRWNHPVRGRLPPGAFIPIAEESGLIARIGEWVIDSACRTAAGWPDGLWVAVNVSPAQFQLSDLPGIAASALRRSGLPAHRLEIEVTESVVIGDSRRALEVLGALRDNGVRLSLDDFGTGFSSLDCLHRLPFDKLKIDRSFIAGLEAGGESATIMTAIAGLGHGLGLSVTAEGVETARQLAMVRAQGCDHVQGWHVGRPMPAEAIASIRLAEGLVGAA